MEDLDAGQTTSICWNPSLETGETRQSSALLPASFQTSAPVLLQERDLLSSLAVIALIISILTVVIYHASSLLLPK